MSKGDAALAIDGMVTMMTGPVNAGNAATSTDGVR